LSVSSGLFCFGCKALHHKYNSIERVAASNASIAGSASFLRFGIVATSTTNAIMHRHQCEQLDSQQL